MNAKGERKEAKSKPDRNTDSNKYIDTKKIVDGFLALKKMCKLPNEEIESGPLFTNEKATILLHVTPKSMRKKGVPNKILLEHPLSYNRAVCFIAKHMDKPAQSGKVIQILKKVGIVGNIKTIPVSLVQLAEKEKNLDALDELAELYDTHLVDTDLNMTGVSTALNKHRKRLIRANLQLGPGLYEEGFRVALATTLVSPTATGKSLDLKVAHVGMTTAQVVENVRTALASLLSKGFPEGYPCLESVRLKSGDRDADAFDLYLDGNDKVVELKQKEGKRREEVEIKVAQKRKAREGREAMESKVPQIPRRSLQLAAGLSALKTLVGWTGHAGQIPRFTDEDSTFYLRFRPVEQIPPQFGNLNTVTLPHPLSMKRRVCLIVPWFAPQVGAPDEPKDVALKDLVKAIGVQGFVQVLHKGSLPRAKQALYTLAEQSDSLLAHESLTSSCGSLYAPLRDTGKALTFVDLVSAGSRKERIKAALAGSAVAIVRGEYLVKVGNTGLTHKQLAENLASALAELLTLPRFPPSLEQFHSIRLENGRSLGAPVFLGKDEEKAASGEEGEDYEAEEVKSRNQHEDLVVTRWDYCSDRILPAVALPDTQGGGISSQDGQRSPKKAKFVQ